MGILLLLVLSLAAAGLAVLTVVSLRQRRRMRLARVASDLGFRYSREDLFNVPVRYAEFALVTSGHCLLASNVISGHLEGLAVRAFDFQYEVGHGTRRMTRQYGVVVVEMPSPLPRLLMWHNGDFTPIPARQATQTRGPWSFLGNAELADGFIAAGDEWFAHGGCVEIRRHAILLATPAPTGRDALVTSLPNIVHTVKRLLVT
ncbi:MAG: hypothetical protein FWE88_03155 [Phycisphaerae bacterium]|nr:hypothetical protein [Phycisphaerae bacterium]